jgi:hypothetical protein
MHGLCSLGTRVTPGLGHSMTQNHAFRRHLLEKAYEWPLLARDTGSPKIEVPDDPETCVLTPRFVHLFEKAYGWPLLARDTSDPRTGALDDPESRVSACVSTISSRKPMGPLLARDTSDPRTGALDDPETRVSSISSRKPMSGLFSLGTRVALRLRCPMTQKHAFRRYVSSTSSRKPMNGLFSLGTRVTPGLGHSMTQRHASRPSPRESLWVASSR